MSVSRPMLVAIAAALLSGGAARADEPGKPLPLLPPIPSVTAPAAKLVAPSGETAMPAVAAPGSGTPVPMIPMIPIGAPVPQGEMPPDFWSWPPAEQLKWLQARLIVLGLVKDFVDTNQKIREAARTSAPLPAMSGPASAPVVVQGAKPPPPAGEPLPMALKIYQRNGRRVADLLVAGQGVRTVQAGSRLGDGLNVVDITDDDVLVTVDRKPVALPANLLAPAGPGPQPAAGLQPFAASDPRARGDANPSASAR